MLTGVQVSFILLVKNTNGRKDDIMRVCMIGGSGHSHTILGQLDHPDIFPLEICGCCRGFEGEALGGAMKTLLQDRGMDIPQFSSYGEMLDRADPELVVVDGLFAHHGPMSVEALNRGIHVYAEKPVATTLKGLSLLRRAAERGNARLGAMLTTRYEAPFYTARKLIREGAIGRIRLVQAQKSYRLGQRPAFFGDRQQFGGLIPWVSIHMIDMILWLTGKKCKRVYASHNADDNRGNGDLEMVALCSMELEDHILASVTTDYYRPDDAPTHGDDRIRIVGTEGILEIMKDTLTLIDGEGCREMPLDTPPDLFGDFLRHIRDELPTGGVGGLDGLYSSYVSLMLRQSADEGRLFDLSAP